ncbi:MAG: hypothetical protein M0R06_06470 [Sphaerochaeta sp.]|jgi:hypothetical protein|nr:hypothetical protein [Sphaerochaeta sp.]MDD4985143.1 hypothetical protein [Dehalococcoidales bacterium]
MAIKVKSAAEASKKWGDVTPGRQAYYESGAVGAGSTWETNTAAAASSYKSAVTAANIGQMFAGGVKKAGAGKYDRKVRDVGVARFGQGVQAAVTDYQTGIEPMLATIASLTLSPRAPRGSESNLARVREVATALNKKRLALRAAGA